MTWLIKLYGKGRVHTRLTEKILLLAIKMTKVKHSLQLIPMC